MTKSTADLSDEIGDSLGYCDLPFHQYGRPRIFFGDVTTVRCQDDNVLLRAVLEEPGTNGIVVVDGAGSIASALFGDQMAQLAIDNGWAGLIINGAVRDIAVLASMNVGVKALGTNPRRGSRTGAGEKNIPVTFGGVTFRPGDHVVSDEDGIVVQAR